MRCPNDDGEMSQHSSRGTNNLPLLYNSCAVCNGLWLKAFDANYLDQETIGKLPDKPASETADRTDKFCPECKALLARNQSDVLPPGVVAWKCPAGHGYFFTARNLKSFKEAVAAKLAYFKLWQIPIPAASGVFLSAIAFLIISLGIFATARGVLSPTQTDTQAKQLIVRQQAFVETKTKTVLFALTTSTDVAASVRFEGPIGNFNFPMSSRDKRQHTYQSGTLSSGKYTYWFTLQQAGKETTSDRFIFVIP